MIGLQKLRSKEEGAVVASFKVLSLNSSGVIEENQIRIVGVSAKIRTYYLPNTSQKLYYLSQISQYKFHTKLFIF
jgi:hypothetical protein